MCIKPACPQAVARPCQARNACDNGTNFYLKHHDHVHKQVNLHLQQSCDSEAACGIVNTPRTSDLAFLLVRLRATGLGPGHHTLSIIIAAATAAVGRLCLLCALCRHCSCCCTACGWLSILNLSLSSLPLLQHQTRLNHSSTNRVWYADQPVLSPMHGCSICPQHPRQELLQQDAGRCLCYRSTYRQQAQECIRQTSLHVEGY